MLGSLRHATDGDGMVTRGREWTPFGPALSEVEGVEVGTAQRDCSLGKLRAGSFGRPFRRVYPERSRGTQGRPSDGVLDLYGLARVGEKRDGEWAYSLGDALNSVWALS